MKLDTPKKGVDPRLDTPNWETHDTSSLLREDTYRRGELLSSLTAVLTISKPFAKKYRNDGKRWRRSRDERRWGSSYLGGKTSSKDLFKKSSRETLNCQTEFDSIHLWSSESLVSDTTTMLSRSVCNRPPSYLTMLKIPSVKPLLILLIYGSLGWRSLNRVSVWKINLYINILYVKETYN